MPPRDTARQISDTLVSTPPDASQGRFWHNRWLSLQGSAAYLAALAGVAVVTLGLLSCRGIFHIRVFPVVYLAFLLFVASAWGRGPATAATLAAAAALDYFFLPSEYTFSSTPEHLALLVAFISTGMLAAQLAQRAYRRTIEAEAGRAEIALLYSDLKEQARDFQEKAQLLDSAHDAIMVRDAESRITFWNQGAVDRYGWSEEEVSGKQSHELFQTEFQEPLDEIMQTLERKGFWEGELKHTCRDGKRIVVASRWVFNKQQPGSILEINNDITARKQAEEQLLRAYADLERRVEARTRDLRESNAALETEIAERKRAEVALAQRSQALARSNAELEQFAYVASHDLQEPLRMVRSYVQLLDRKYTGLFDAKGKEFMAYAVDGATRMQSLIDDLLAYSRVDSQGQEFAPTDTAVVVRLAIENLKSAIEESGARITWGSLPVVRADSSQLLQLFQNLISNAIKFREERTPEIHITAERADGAWRFAVQDNGIGIDPQYFERIFLIFQRLHGRRRYPGSGIGLAVCRRIIDRHGGKIWLESEPGKGTTFFFTVPDEPGDSK